MRLYFKPSVITGLVALLLLLSQDIHAHDKKTLTWLTLDWQPAWIMSGPLKGEGYIGASSRMVQHALPQYEHRHQTVTNVRIYDVLRARNSCFAASSYQGNDLAGLRRDYVITSMPSFFTFYHGIIFPEALRPRLKPYIRDDKIVFLDLLQDKHLIGAYQPGRNYSPWLNGVFSDKKKTAGMFYWSENLGLNKNMFKMLEAKRFDYFVDYSMLLNFHEIETQRTGEFAYLPLWEHGDNGYGLGAIACSNTPQGRDYVNDINKALVKIRPTAAYAEALARWLMPRELEKRYWQIWHDEVLKRTE